MKPLLSDPEQVMCEQPDCRFCPMRDWENLDDDEKAVSNTHHCGGQNAWIISESGLYTLIFRSRKPKAQVFRKIFTEDNHDQRGGK